MPLQLGSMLVVTALLLILGLVKSNAPGAPQPPRPTLSDVEQQEYQTSQPPTSPAEHAGDEPTIRFAPSDQFSMDVSIDDEQPSVISGTPLAPDSHERIRALIQREIDRYPSGVLSGGGTIILSTVIVFDKLMINGQRVAGTYMAGIVFLAAGDFPNAGPQSDSSIARTFHHELSSIFKMRYNQLFNETRFREALPKDFVYDNEKPEADPNVVLTGWNAVGSIEDVANGFLAQYATTSLGQDFNSYAELLLWRPEILIHTFAPESAVGRKVRVVRDFYIGIDPRFKVMLEPVSEPVEQGP